MIKGQMLSSWENWGWKMENNKLMPHWTDIPKAKIAIWDLIKWYCKPEKGCEWLASVCSHSYLAQNCGAVVANGTEPNWNIW